MPGDILMPLPEDQIARLALIEALRANTDAVNRLAVRSDTQEHKLDDIGKTLNGIDRRLAILEHNSIPRDIERIEHTASALATRVDSLEGGQKRRDGAVGLLEWFGKNWLGLAAFAVAIFYLLKNMGLLK